MFKIQNVSLIQNRTRSLENIFSASTQLPQSRFLPGNPTEVPFCKVSNRIKCQASVRSYHFLVFLQNNLPMQFISNSYFKFVQDNLFPYSCFLIQFNICIRLYMRSPVIVAIIYINPGYGKLNLNLEVKLNCKIVQIRSFDRLYIRNYSYIYLFKY